MFETGAMKHILEHSDLNQFWDKGYLGPFTALEVEEMAVVRERLDREVFTTPGLSSNVHQSRHLDSKVVYDLCSHPAVVERMAQIYGPDLLLWRSHFFCKEPGGVEIPWHQDLSYWPIEPALNITAWMAIDRVTEENSCVQLIPGSHKSALDHVEYTKHDEWTTTADPSKFDASDAVKMELEPGQFFLFNEKMLHHSVENRSNLRRMGLAIRVTIPIVKVDHGMLFSEHRNLLLCGEDRMGFSRVGQPPVE